MIMMRLQLHDHSCFGYRRSPAVFEFSLSNPSAIAVDIPLHSPMELLEVLITLPLNSNCTCGCYYGNCECTYNC
jgi:hypothetical protein